VKYTSLFVSFGDHHPVILRSLECIIYYYYKYEYNLFQCSKFSINDQFLSSLNVELFISLLSYNTVKGWMSEYMVTGWYISDVAGGESCSVMDGIMVVSETNSCSMDDTKPQDAVQVEWTSGVVQNGGETQVCLWVTPTVLNESFISVKVEDIQYKTSVVSCWISSPLSYSLCWAFSICHLTITT
jgi:hypothetical protein